MKTVVISCFHNLISRNILSSGVLAKIVAGGVRVVILVPPSKEFFFNELYASDSVIIEPVSVPTVRSEKLIQFISLSIAGIQNHIIADLWRDGGRFRYILAHAIHICFAPFFVSHRILRFAAGVFLTTDAFSTVFEKYNPDLIFVTDVFDRHDRLLVAEAKRRSIATVGMIRSWDNATSKGVFLFEPGHIIVPNEVLKEEMISIHRVTSDRITVTGIPHYDLTIETPKSSREAFCSEVGLDSGKKIILFAPAGKILYQHDDAILALLKECLDSESLREDVQFLVRFPPGDEVDIAAVAGDKRFVIDSPGTRLTKRKKDSELSPSDNDRLNNSLRYSDVVLTVVSTIAIDGAVFDRPTIVLGFDPGANLSDSIGRFPKEPHFKKFLDSGMVSIAHDRQELVANISDYIKHPDHDAGKRAQIRARYAYRVDGDSAQRVASCVLHRLG